MCFTLKGGVDQGCLQALSCLIFAISVPVEAGAQTTNQPAVATSTREKELEARVAELEAAVADLRARSDSERHDVPSGQIQAASAPSAPTSLASGPPSTIPVSARGSGTGGLARTFPAPAAAGSGIVVKLSGQFKTVGALSAYSGANLPAESLIRDWYVPSLIPVGNARTTHDSAFNAKQTRLVVTATMPLGGHDLKALLDTDFQVTPGSEANQRFINGYNPALRRAIVSWGPIQIGQDQTTWQYMGALPETTDFVGPTEGTIFVRQAQVRYTAKLTRNLTAAIGIENPETAYMPMATQVMTTVGNDTLPDIAGRLNWTTGSAEFSLGGIARRLTAVTAAGASHAAGWGISFSGKARLGQTPYTDFRFMLTHGSGIGRYIGFLVIPDGVVDASGDLSAIDLTAGFAAFRLGLGGTWRSTLTYSFQKGHYTAELRPALANNFAQSAAINLFASPLPNIDVGIEYRHGYRRLNSNDSGTIDRQELSFRYTF